MSRWHPSIQNDQEPGLPWAGHMRESQYKLLAGYITVGVLGAYTWEILNKFGDEYKLLSKYHITLPTIIYFMSKLSTLSFILLSTIFEAAPIRFPCDKVELAVDISYSFAISLTSLLFLFRVRAVFSRNKVLVALLSFMWVIVLGCSMSSINVKGSRIDQTRYCRKSQLKLFTIIAPISSAVFDTLVFCAISWRMLQNAHVDQNFKNRTRVLVAGKYLPIFSKAILQDGQKYYLATVGISLLCVTLIAITSIPIDYRAVSINPHLAMTNIMACRVFLNAKFELFREASALEPRDGVPLVPDGNSGKNPITLILRGHLSRGTKVGTRSPTIEVTKTVECINDYDDKEKQPARQDSAV